MKTFDQLKSDLAHQLREDMPVYFIDRHEMNAETMASWILEHYKPPVEYEIVSADYRNEHRLRVTLAGKVLRERPNDDGGTDASNSPRVEEAIP